MKILVVIDMQNDFISGSLGTKEAEGIVDNVVELIESGDFDWIYYTEDTHAPEPYSNSQEGKKLPIDHCMVGTDGWSIHPRIQDAIDNFRAISFMKNTFGSIDLANKIEEDQFFLEINKNNDSLQIDVVGLCTDICVITNVLTIKSFVPEAEIRVHTDCCAGTTPENHEAALKVMKACLIDIV